MQNQCQEQRKNAIKNKPTHGWYQQRRNNHETKSWNNQGTKDQTFQQTVRMMETGCHQYFYRFRATWYWKKAIMA
jgi:hypothetical protein